MTHFLSSLRVYKYENKKQVTLTYNRKNKMNNKVLVSIMILMISQPLYAVNICTQTGNNITLLGRDDTGSIYAGVTEHNNQCGCNSFRFKEINTDTQMALSILLSAKLSDKEIRVDLKDENDCNSAFKLYIH